MIKHHLHNFFIPHEGNNYHPHVLHTKRAVFYGSFFVGLKFLLIGFAALIPSYVFVMPDVLADEAAKIVSYTNQLREIEGVAPMRGEIKLHGSAQDKADDMADREYFGHTGPEGTNLADWLSGVGYNYVFAGENLAMGFFDAREVVDAWIESPTHYANLIDPDFTELGIGIQAGEYGEMPTAYMVQHFATPAAELAGNATIITSAPVLDSVKIVEEQMSQRNENTFAMVAGDTDDVALLSSAEQEDTYYPIDYSFAYFPTESYVSWENVHGGKTILRVHAEMNGDAVSAIAMVRGYPIELFKSEDEEFVWIGETTVFESVEDLMTPITIPTIAITRQNGEMHQYNIAWQDIQVASPTPFEKYSKAKTSLAGFTSVFDVSRMVYVVAILFFTIALAIKILVAYHKQHHHIVLQTVLLIALLVILFEI